MATKRTPGWLVGKFHGAPIIIQPWTLLMFAVIAFLFANDPSGFSAFTVGLGVMYALGLFSSILLHELAHAMAARAFKIEVKEIVLTLWGGHTAVDGSSVTPLNHAITGLAGPAMNASIGAIAGIASGFAGDGWLAIVLQSIALANVFLALFNALPGIPLDGGRLLESIVWAATGKRTKGIVAAAWGGRIVAIVVGLYFIASPFARGSQPTISNALAAVFVASIIWPAASASLRYAKVMEKREAATARSLMTTAVAVPFADSVSNALNLAARTGAGAIVILGADGSPAGFASMETVQSVPSALRDSTEMATTITPLPRGATVESGLTGDELIATLREWWGKTPSWVVIEQGAVVGILALPTVVEAVS